jgi:hypothetical protein
VIHVTPAETDADPRDREPDFALPDFAAKRHTPDDNDGDAHDDPSFGDES